MYGPYDLETLAYLHNKGRGAVFVGLTVFTAMCNGGITISADVSAKDGDLRVLECTHSHMGGS